MIMIIEFCIDADIIDVPQFIIADADYYGVNEYDKTLPSLFF